MDRDIVSESNGIKRVVIEKEDDLYTQRKKKIKVGWTEEKNIRIICYFDRAVTVKQLSSKHLYFLVLWFCSCSN